MLTQEKLRSLIQYLPETGQFFWIVKKCRAEAGDLAGYLGGYGYWIIKIDQKKYQAHRLAWLWMTGSWPSDFIDHINRDKADNRWANLREATQKQNQENNGKHMRGIRWEEDRQRWLVRIKHHGVSKNLGRFIDLDEAISVRRTAERKQFTHSPACGLPAENLGGRAQQDDA